MILFETLVTERFAEMELSSGAKIRSQPQPMNDRHAGTRPCQRKICRLGSKILKKLADNLPEAPASSAIVTASEEVPQVQDLEVDPSKIDLAELVWGLGVSNLNT